MPEHSEEIEIEYPDGVQWATNGLPRVASEKVVFKAGHYKVKEVVLKSDLYGTLGKNTFHRTISSTAFYCEGDDVMREVFSIKRKAIKRVMQFYGNRTKQMKKAKLMVDAKIARKTKKVVVENSTSSSIGPVDFDRITANMVRFVREEGPNND